jgi:hypothetical protein
MATEVIITEFRAEVKQFTEGIDRAEESVLGLDTAEKGAQESTKGLNNELGKATGKANAHRTAMSGVSKGLKDVNKEANAAGIGLESVKDKATEAVPALGRVGGAVKVLGTIFKAAFGPVVLLIGLVVSAIAGLGAAFLSTERGGDALQKVTSIVTTVLDRLLGIAQKVSFVLVDAFNNPKQAVADLWEAIKQNLVTRLDGLVDQFKAFGEVVAGVFTLDFDRVKAGALDFGESTVQALTGVDDAVGKARAAFGRLGAEIDAATEAGKRLFDIDESLEDLAIRRAKEEGRLNRTIAEQLAVARDVNAATEDRKAAAEKAIAAQNQLAGLALKENALLLERAKLEQEQSDKGAEGLLKIAQLEGQREQIVADRIDAGKRASAIINGIDAENAAAALERDKKQQEADAERLKQRLGIEQELNDRLDELRQQRELAGLSETDRAIEEAKIAAAKEIETAGALYDNLEKLAADDANAIVDIRAQQAENIALIEQGLVDKIEKIREDAAKVKTDEEVAEIERLKKLEEDRIAIMKNAASQVEGVVVGLADGTIKSAEDTSKALIGIALEAAEQQALISAASAIAKELGNKGIAGIVTGLAAAAIIKAAFAALRSQISGAYEGERLIGAGGERPVWSGKDGFLRRVHKNEGIVDAKTNTKYLPYIDMMRDGSFGSWVQSLGATNSYNASTPSIRVDPFNDRRLVGAMSGVGSLREQRKQTELLAMVAQGLNRGRNARYTA